MSDEQLAECFGNKNWHKTSAKTKLMKKFAKQLKGSTNADLYIDKSTGEVLLKGNKNSVWVRTGVYIK